MLLIGGWGNMVSLEAWLCANPRTDHVQKCIEESLFRRLKIVPGTMSGAVLIQNLNGSVRHG